MYLDKINNAILNSSLSSGYTLFVLQQNMKLQKICKEKNRDKQKSLQKVVAGLCSQLRFPPFPPIFPANN